MKHLSRWIGVIPAAALIVLATGCAAERSFVYSPNPPAADARKLPVKVAVLPFADGTEDFTKRGSVLGKMQCNLAKIGVPGRITALPPEFWGKSFADELAASGSFRFVRFLYGPSELGDEGFSVDGTLKKVLFAYTLDASNELLLTFKATRISDRKVVWEKEVGKAWKMPTSLYNECLSAGCVHENKRVDFNRNIAALFAEARADLVETRASAGAAAAGSAGAIAEGESAGAAGEPLERTIDRILKGK
jgi:hypothetical protein